MDPDKRQRLRKNHTYFKQSLKIQPLLDELYTQDVISDLELEAIRVESPTAEQIHQLLDCIKRSGNTGYDVFCEALKKLQPDALTTLELTVIDKETIGEHSDVNTFFNPSEDFELNGLIDQLTIGNKISQEQLERMKNIVTDENGCAEEILMTKDTPQKFLRLLMKRHLLTRYNLALIQALLWRVGLKSLCQDVAAFARQSGLQPIYFYTPRDKAENGYSFCKFHITGDPANFKGIRIQDIVLRVSRYIGVPLTQVIPDGLEPSESLLLTLMIKQEAAVLLERVGDYAWLSDLGVDIIWFGDKRIDIPGTRPTENINSEEVKVLETKLKVKMESERHLKQCLYDEQISNEALKDLQAEQEERLRRTDDTLNGLRELVKERMELLDKDQSEVVQAKTRYAVALKKAQRWSSNHSSLIELTDATTELKVSQLRGFILVLQSQFLQTLSGMHAEYQMERLTARQLGAESSVDEIRQRRICAGLADGTLIVWPMLQEMLRSFASRLDDTERGRLYETYNVPKSLKTPDMRHTIFEYIVLSELEKAGAVTCSEDALEEIMKAALKTAKRKDLWEEFQAGIAEHLKRQEEQMSGMPRGTSDITDRLDKIEKMVQTIAGQNFKANMGFPGVGLGGFVFSPAGNVDDILGYMKGRNVPFSN